LWFFLSVFLSLNSSGNRSKDLNQICLHS
jgi:hypothetical protein